MGARSIPRPDTGIPNSPEDIFRWLEYLCLSSSCRGLAGHELSQCDDLLNLRWLTEATNNGGPALRADALRKHLRQHFALQGAEPGVQDDARSQHHRATLHLLGLSNVAYAQSRPERRRLAAEALGLVLDTFQKRYEGALLRDVAEELWRNETAT